jgi:hypothetical protein
MQLLAHLTGHEGGNSGVMDFIVQTLIGEDPYDRDARYAVENGVLTAYAADGSRVVYAPTFWQRVTVSDRLAAAEAAR